MITTKEMKEIEMHSEEIGVSRAELMENAGRRIAEEIEDKYGDDIGTKHIIIICGQGNNGGDGFVAARLLNDVCKVDVLFLGDKDRLPPEAAINYDCLKDMNKEMIIDYASEQSVHINLLDYNVVIDAMLGTGAKGPLRHPYNEFVRQINATRQKTFIVSVDIPTGLDPDTGKSHDGLFVDAHLIITFHDIKPGLNKFKKIVKIVDIGIPF